MNKFKNNIFLYIIIAISIFAIATGVYSATSVKQGVSGSISYEAPVKISQLASTWNSDEAGKGGLFDSNVSSLTKSNIYSITFTQDSSLLTSDYGEPLALNLAETGTQKIYVYKKVSAVYSDCYDVKIYSAYSIYAPKDCSYAFNSWTKVTSITFDNFNTRNVTNMQSMFYGCNAYILDLSGFDTSNVTDMSWMFATGKFYKLILKSFDTSKVTDMNGMFNNLWNIDSLDVSNFDTSQVKDMSGMFVCLKNNLDLSNFDTSNVTDMSWMFAQSRFSEIDLSNFDTSNVTNMSYMFSESGLTTIYVSSSWNTDNVKTATNMFSYCSSLVGGNDTACDGTNNIGKTYARIDRVDTPGYFTANSSALASTWKSTTDDDGGLFDSNGSFGLNKSKIATITFTNVEPSGQTPGTGYKLVEPGDCNVKVYASKNTSNTSLYDVVLYSKFIIYAPQSCVGAFSNLENVTSIVFNNFNTSKVTNMLYMFFECRNLTSLDLSNFDTSNVIEMSFMFNTCSSLTSLNLSNFNTSKVYDMEAMFTNCSSLTSLNLSSFDTSNVSDMNEMFNKCSSLQSLDVSSFDTSKVTNMEAMFTNCSSLTSLNLSNFDTSNVTVMSFMFNYCTGLTSLDISSFNTRNVYNMGSIFTGCSSLKSLDVSSFDTSNVINMEYMFSSCSKLTDLSLTNFDTRNVNNMSYMFNGCSGLQSLDVSSFNTSNVYDMRYMFQGCSGLNKLNLISFDTSNVGDMLSMFDNCSSLKTIVVGDGWNTDKVGTGYAMFSGCTELVGGNNTTYDANYIDKTYAQIDLNDTKGYLTGYTTKLSSNWQSTRAGVGGLFDSTNKTVLKAATVATLLFTSDSSYLTNPDYSYLKNSSGEYVNLAESGGYLPILVLIRENGSLYDVVIYSECNILAPASCVNMFNLFTKITSIVFENFDTSNITDMSGMFAVRGTNTTLTTLNLKSFDTSNVNSMSNMFRGQTKLTTIIVGEGWNTDNVTTSTNMFYNCTSLVGGNGTAFDSSIINAGYARIDTYETPGYLTVNTTLSSNWNSETAGAGGLFDSNVSPLTKTNIKTITFTSNSSLITSDYGDPLELNLAESDLDKIYVYIKLNTSTHFYNVIIYSKCNIFAPANCTKAFAGLTYVAEITLKNFNTSNVTDMSYMFNSCIWLETINVVDGWNTDNVTTSTNMFYNCRSLVGGNGTKYNGSKPIDKTYASIDTYENPGYLTANATLNENWIEPIVGARSIFDSSNSIVISEENLASITFTSNISLITGYTKIKRGNGVDLNLANESCYKIEAYAKQNSSNTSLYDVIIYSKCNIYAPDYLYFADCIYLTSVTFGNLNTSEVTDMEEMFSGCSALTTIIVSTSWSTAKVTSSENMFYNCTSLVGGNNTECDGTNNIDKTYARVDADGTPGYLTLKER